MPEDLDPPAGLAPAHVPLTMRAPRSLGLGGVMVEETGNAPVALGLQGQAPPLRLPLCGPGRLRSDHLLIANQALS